MPIHSPQFVLETFYGQRCSRDVCTASTLGLGDDHFLKDPHIHLFLQYKVDFHHLTSWTLTRESINMTADNLVVQYPALLSHQTFTAILLEMAGQSVFHEPQ